MNKILLRGYYGFGNFGDDLLLIVSYRLLRKFFPSAEVDVMVHGDHYHYINKLLETEVEFIKPGESRHYDLIVHGGGGVHFDFREGPFIYKLLNRSIRLIGYRNYIRLEALLRRIMKKTLLTSKERWGWGIGVGTFTAGSKEFHQKITAMADYDKLFVRDEESRFNLEKLRIKTRVKVLTDIVFLKELWLPDLKQQAKNKNAIGFILRDWKFGKEDYLEKMLKVAGDLQRKGYQVTCFALHEHTDKIFIGKFKEFTVHVWQPDKMDIAEYMQLLSAQSLLVSSRAHGAITGACIGIPAVCIEIEPKMKNVHQMLIASSILINPYEMSADDISKSVSDKFALNSQTDVEKDVKRNREKLDDLFNILEL